MNQIKEDEEFTEKFTDTVNRLRQALAILDPTIVINIGGKVAFFLLPEIYDEFNYIPLLISVQVYRYYSRREN